MIAVQLQAGCHILVDRHGRKRIRLLKHHADPAPQLGRRRTVVGVVLADLYFAFHSSFRRGLMHAIQATDERRLPAARRPNQRGRVVCLHIQVDVLQRLGLAIPGIQVFHPDSDTHD